MAFNVYAQEVCDGKIKEITDWIKKSNGGDHYYVSFYISTMNVVKYKEDKNTNRDGWISYTEGKFENIADSAGASPQQPIDSYFSDRKRDMNTIDGKPGLIVPTPQRFDYRSPTPVGIKLVPPNKLYFTYYWGGTKQPGEAHTANLTCNGDLMYGFSSSNPSVMFTIGINKFVKYILK